MKRFEADLWRQSDKIYFDHDSNELDGGEVIECGRLVVNFIAQVRHLNRFRYCFALIWLSFFELAFGSILSLSLARR